MFIVTLSLAGWVFLLNILQGHVKVVKCLVEYVTQFPSDGDCRRFVSTIADKVRVWGGV